MPRRPKSIANHVPTSDRDKKFCEAWLRHFDHMLAYQEAGFSTKSHNISGRARKKLARYKPYLEPLRLAKAEQVGKQLAVSEGDVLETMKALAFANIQDYYVEGDEVLAHTVPDPKAEGGQRLEPVMFRGSPVKRMEPKPLLSLTRAQALAVEPQYVFGVLVGYKLLSQKTRHQYLHSLGQNLGLWLDEFAKGQSDEKHLHLHAHFESVPTDQLNSAQDQLVRLLGVEYARAVGLTEEEISRAMKGVTIDASPIHGDQEKHSSS